MFVPVFVSIATGGMALPTFFACPHACRIVVRKREKGLSSAVLAGFNQVTYNTLLVRAASSAAVKWLVARRSFILYTFSNIAVLFKDESLWPYDQLTVCC